MSREDDLPSSPPLEVQREIAAAAAAFERLSSAGRRVHFGFDGNARAAVELWDLAGNPVSPLSPSDALQLAGGHLIR